MIQQDKMDDEYANEITKLAVARACLALGFKQCEKSALDSMADILQNYMRMLGANAQEQTEISGRVHAGIQDLIPVLESTVSYSYRHKLRCRIVKCASFHS